MSNNIFEQLVIENDELLVFSSSSKSLQDQAAESKRIIPKILNNKESIDSIATDAVTYVAKKRESTNTSPVDTAASDIIQAAESSLAAVEDYNNKINHQNDIVSAASRIEYRISKSIDITYEESTAKEIYNIKNNPQIVAERTDIYKILKEEAERYSANINYINSSNSNNKQNLKTAKDLL